MNVTFLNESINQREESNKPVDEILMTTSVTCRTCPTIVGSG